MGRGGKLESTRPGGAGGEAAVTCVHSLGRQHALLRLLVTKRNSGFLSPCLGWSRNPRRPVAFSPPLLRATDLPLTDEGNVQTVWVSVASGAHLCGSSPHCPSTCFFEPQAIEKGLLVLCGSWLRLRPGESHLQLPGKFRLPQGGFTVWQQPRLIIIPNLSTPAS